MAIACDRPRRSILIESIMYDLKKIVFCAVVLCVWWIHIAECKFMVDGRTTTTATTTTTTDYHYSIVTNGEISFPGIIVRPSVYRQCETPVLKNGIVRLRQRGKLIRYQCAPTFTLYGDRYSGCQMGRWEHPVPICISNC